MGGSYGFDLGRGFAGLRNMKTYMDELWDVIDWGRTNYYVDGTNGDDANDGLTWATAFATIGAAMSAATTLGGRGRPYIYVAPGGYTETILTPLNADAPFGALIAVSPTSRSWGATYLASPSAGLPVITVRARGWRIHGFEIDSPTGAAAILLQRSADGTLRSAGTEIDGNFIGATITGLYGVEFEGADTYIHIHDNDFSLLQAAGAAGIFCNTTPFALALLAIIERNDFRENVNHIACGASWGLNAALIRHNTFQVTGDQVPTKILDLSGGRNNLVYGNHLGVENGTGAGQYDETNGKCLAGTNDAWAGNYLRDGLSDKNPGSGS